MDYVISVGTEGVTLDQVCKIAAGAKAELSEDARRAVAAARKQTMKIVSSGIPVYGVNTGFGRLSGSVVSSAPRE